MAGASGAVLRLIGVDEMEEARCQNPYCGRLLEIKRGHRKRRYCDNNNQCKQAAYRKRKTRRKRDSKYEAELQERRQFQERWPTLGFGTMYFLQDVQKRYGETFLVQMVNVILREKELSSSQARIELLESLSQSLHKGDSEQEQS